MAAQLEITLTKADSEQLARSIAEEQYSDLEKEKIMKELELKEMMARHRQELAEKDITISSVSCINLSLAPSWDYSAHKHTGRCKCIACTSFIKTQWKQKYILVFRLDSRWQQVLIISFLLCAAGGGQSHADK